KESGRFAASPLAKPAKFLSQITKPPEVGLHIKGRKCPRVHFHTNRNQSPSPVQVAGRNTLSSPCRCQKTVSTIRSVALSATLCHRQAKDVCRLNTCLCSNPTQTFDRNGAANTPYPSANFTAKISASTSTAGLASAKRPAMSLISA